MISLLLSGAHAVVAIDAENSHSISYTYTYYSFYLYFFCLKIVVK